MRLRLAEVFAGDDEVKIGIQVKQFTGCVGGKVHRETMTLAPHGGVLLDPDNPGRVIARARTPFMAPEALHEKEGYVPDVVFPSGTCQKGDDLLIYYGAADAHICVAKRSTEKLIRHIQQGR